VAESVHVALRFGRLGSGQPDSSRAIRRNLHGSLPGTEGIVIGMDLVAYGRRVRAGKVGTTLIALGRQIYIGGGEGGKDERS